MTGFRRSGVVGFTARSRWQAPSMVPLCIGTAQLAPARPFKKDDGGASVRCQTSDPAYQDLIGEDGGLLHAATRAIEPLKAAVKQVAVLNERCFSLRVFGATP